MKKAFLIILFFGCKMIHGHAASLALDMIKDPALKNCVEQHAKKQGWSKPEEITRIKCHNHKIKSIEGINAFSNLSELSLYKNQLDDVSLADFSQLTTLNLAGNKLEKLNLNNLPQLKTAYLFNNRLKQLEVTNLPQLELLKGNNNQLELFSYNTLPTLEKIYLFDNQLKTIDIHHLPNLQYMDVRQNPMPDELYEEMDARQSVTFLHDGNAEDWQ